jgi:hypothetical protein
MIQRFEDEYPETRPQAADTASTHSSNPSTSPPASTQLTLTSSLTDTFGQDSDEDEPKALRSRHNSDVSLASRAQTLEEGRLHRLGHRVRAEIFNPSRPTTPDYSNGSDGYDNLPNHLLALREYFYKYSGEELKDMSEGVGWEKAFEKIVQNAEELKTLERESPEEFAKFRESQISALKNRNPQVVFDAKEREDDFAVED